MKYFAILLLTGCTMQPVLPPDFTPSAELCRAYGVEAYGEITGTIIEEQHVWGHDVQKGCNQPLKAVHGCAMPQGNNEWVLVHDAPLRSCIPQHEGCHALNETPWHTLDYLTRLRAGDMYAACGYYRGKWLTK